MVKDQLRKGRVVYGDTVVVGLPHAVVIVGFNSKNGKTTWELFDSNTPGFRTNKDNVGYKPGTEVFVGGEYSFWF